MSDQSSSSSNSGTPPSPNSSGRRWRWAVVLFAMAISSAIVGTGVWWISRTKASEPQKTTPVVKDRYLCPMHPSIVQDHPGDCPICGMKLVKVEEKNAGKSGSSSSTFSEGKERKILHYRSPMNPKVTSSAPKKDEMGMDYLPVYADEAGEPSSNSASSGSSASSVPGQATVEIDPGQQQLIGLTTAPVTKGPIGGAWRTVGRVAIDETRVRRINLKVSGFAERVYVDFVGKAVKKGDPLFTVYSPELVSAQEEYLLALRTRTALASGNLTADGDALVKAARSRLVLWDIPQAEIDRIGASGEITKTLTIYSPFSGVVTKKEVVPGMKLDAGAMPYEIVDLSQVWVLADIYESELRFIKQGLAATLTLNAFPNLQLKGRVIFIDPILDAQTRTAKVRLAFPNSTKDLRPEMFGEVVIHGAPREKLRIPQDAVIDSGTEKIVFVALGNGKFEPRSVGLGTTDGQMVEVVRGLQEGEQVVTRANFLIDSESQLRASLAQIAGGNTNQPGAPERARVLPDQGLPQDSGSSNQSPSNQGAVDQGAGGVHPPTHQGHGGRGP